MDIENLKAQIKLNCDISDAKFWGHYSLCGLLMRLRELYRSEKSLAPWDEIPRDEMSEWIAAREAQWKNLENETLRPLEINGTFYDPFEIEGINGLLLKYGLLYGGGYGRFNKPTFFLAQLEEERELYDYRAYYTGKEYCRDLSTSVAMLQGRCIFMRLDSLKMFLWDKLEELRVKKFKGLLKEAFSSYGFGDIDVPPEELYQKIERLSSALSELFVLHELGEAFEDERSEEWLDMLGRNRDRAAEFFLRGTKDLLADTSDRGPLKSITDKRDRPLLNFYMLFLDGMRKELFPEIVTAFQKFVEEGDWAEIEEARETGYGRAKDLRGQILRLWNEGKREDIASSVKQYLKISKGTH